MRDRILYRAKQFWFALVAKMTEEDRLYVHQNLNLKEAAMFFTLPEYEQKHAVVVAQKMVKLAQGFRHLDQKKVIRLGLLHDVGKVGAKLSIFDKGLLVILHRVLPPVYDTLALWGRGDKPFFYFKKFYVHKHHGVVGAEMLKKVSENEDIIDEIRRHDEPVSEHDVYLKILDLADSTF